MKIYSFSFLLISTILLGIRNIKSSTNYFEKHIVSEKPECLGQPFSKFVVRKSDGSKFSNHNFSNKIVFVTFWRESSPTCITELEEFNEMFAKFKDSSNFLFVSFSPDEDSTLVKLTSKYNIKYDFIHMDIKECQRLNHNFGFPSSFLLDKKGKIAFYIPQLVFDREVMKGEVFYVFNREILKLL
jgi:peroxiredoxin